MSTPTNQIIVVLGATGLQGGAVTRHLLANGWSVRAVTRNRQGQKAQRLAALGAEVVQADMDDPGSLVPVFANAYGLYNVQNPFISGIDGEIRQGKNVAGIARQAGIQHLVYGSAGTGRRDTGIPSWESKLIVEDYMRSLDLPLTVLRPMAFMELMTDETFFPPVSTWHVMPRLMGGDREVGWLSADDLGFIAATAFAAPAQFIGQELQLASDVQSVDACRVLYRQVMGKNPPRWPVPAWLFARFGLVGKDLTTMWRWLRTHTIDLDTSATLALHPHACTVRTWLESQRAATAGAPAPSLAQP